MLANGRPLHPGDPGGPGGGLGSMGNRMNGDYTGPLLPDYMDPTGTAGQLQYLKMESTAGVMPQDPFLLRLSVEKAIGGPIFGAFKENRGLSYVLKVRSQEQVNRLLRMTQLQDSTPIRITEHPFLNQRKCVVTNHDSTGLTDSYLVEQLANQGVKEVKRITRRTPDGKRENTATIVLTIRGTVIPDHVDFGWSRCKTRKYYPSPMLCFRCWEYGHSGKRCTSSQRICGRCSKAHPEDQEAANADGGNPEKRTDDIGQRPRYQCTEAPSCKHCRTADHPVSSRKCPVYEKEMAIQQIRVDMDISYPQARREYEARQGASRSSGTFSGVVNASKDTEIAELQDTIKKLQTDAEARETRMAEMEQALQNYTMSNRIETVKEHGTIGELIKQVAALTETVKNLQDALAVKDRHILRQSRIISQLRGSQKAPSEQDTPTVVDHTEAHEQIETTASQSSSEHSATKSPNLDPKVAERVTNWISNVASKNQRQPTNDQLNDGNLSDHSMTSALSKKTETSNVTHNSNPTKRVHSASDHSCQSGDSNSPATDSKRKNKNRKRGGQRST